MPLFGLVGILTTVAYFDSTDTAQLTKQVSELTAIVEKLQKRVEELERKASPAPLVVEASAPAKTPTLR